MWTQSAGEAPFSEYPLYVAAAAAVAGAADVAAAGSDAAAVAACDDVTDCDDFLDGVLGDAIAAVGFAMEIIRTKFKQFP